MNQKIKKVLSIDWDYFQNVTKKQIDEYPDGIETIGELNIIVWATRYSNMHPNFDPKEIRINQELYSTMLSIIRNQNKTIPAMISESHSDCYRLICQKFDTGIDTIQLYNVDLHHDMFNDNEELDCGNWINHVSKEFDTEVSWFNRSVSLEAYKISKKNGMRMYTDSLDEIKDMQFDAIFLCKSSAWIPPHLDEFFRHMGSAIIDVCENTSVDKGRKVLDLRPYEMTTRLLDSKLDKIILKKARVI